jgi:L-ascorbate metabolism protein UlaG (beta-lactamase superfamily)
MKKITGFICLFSMLLFGNANGQLPQPDVMQVQDSTLTIQPVKHASLVLSYHQKNIYVDPSGGADLFKGTGTPNIIIITDIHGDHMDVETLKALKTTNAVYVVPKAVADLLPKDLYKQELIVLNNGDKVKVGDIEIAAVPMYNLPEQADSRHPKGRGNGYILTIGGKRVYISGDTEDTPEMRNLQNIDIAFVCMNLPNTMDIKQAADGVLAFKPAIVYPYHYRGQDTDQFKSFVNVVNPAIDVRLRDWYAGK